MMTTITNNEVDNNVGKDDHNDDNNDGKDHNNDADDDDDDDGSDDGDKTLAEMNVKPESDWRDDLRQRERRSFD